MRTHRRASGILEGGERNVVAPPTPIQHAAAHTGTLLSWQTCVLSCLAESRLRGDFDIYDAACAGFDRRQRHGMAYGLVETDRRTQFALQSSVVVDVVIPQGLLDQSEA